MLQDSVAFIKSLRQEEFVSWPITGLNHASEVHALSSNPGWVGVYKDCKYPDGTFSEGYGVPWCARCMVELFPLIQSQVLMRSSVVKKALHMLLSNQNDPWATQYMYAEMSRHGSWGKLPSVEEGVVSSTVRVGEARDKVAAIISRKGSNWSEVCKDCVERARQLRSR